MDHKSYGKSITNIGYSVPNAVRNVNIPNGAVPVIRVNNNNCGAVTGNNFFGSSQNPCVKKPQGHTRSFIMNGSAPMITPVTSKNTNSYNGVNAYFPQQH